MFSLKVVDTDEFLDMGQGSQLLYFHLAMRADDDGFVNSPKKIMRFAGAKDDDVKVLIAKQFIIPFQSGVIVIRHWKENNEIRKDRKIDTVYKEEMALLSEDNAGVYQMSTICQPDDNQTSPQVRLGEVRIGKDRLGKDRIVEEEEIITPHQIANDFLNKEEKQEHFIQEVVSRGVNESTARQETKEFVSYWTELNGTGKKQRWQMEKTFEVQRRLATWFSKVSNFNKPTKKVGYTKAY